MPINYTPTTHAGGGHVAAVTPATGGSLTVYGLAPGELITALVNDPRSANAPQLLPVALDPDGFPSGRASNQRVINAANVGTVG
jgi:hypothetical protein